VHISILKGRRGRITVYPPSLTGAYKDMGKTDDVSIYGMQARYDKVLRFYWALGVSGYLLIGASPPQSE
jgi:hypothetical protein